MNTTHNPTAWAEGFPYIANRHAKVLILGSMPGQASLKQARYYAHPRNSFWSIMQALLGLPDPLSYSARLDHLVTHGIALWDVAHQCYRPGSLDSRIDSHSVIPNALDEFLHVHSQVKLIAFNGQTAQRLFQRHFPQLPMQTAVDTVTLPSTSPAHAALTFADKRQAWQIITSYL